MDTLNLKPLQIVAHVESDFSGKFGIPRQSGLTDLPSLIVFEPEFCMEGALDGLEEFSHVWVLWLFSKSYDAPFSPTVRPPKLGGNTRKGVFASRSPFRPNSIGLSSVKIGRIFKQNNRFAIEIFGGDMADGTPVIDVKPYVPYSDCHSCATGGFSSPQRQALDVTFSENALLDFPQDKTAGLTQVLALDPRPAYQDDPDRIYKFEFAGYTISFCVSNGTLTVLSAKKLQN